MPDNARLIGNLRDQMRSWRARGAMELGSQKSHQQGSTMPCLISDFKYL